MIYLAEIPNISIMKQRFIQWPVDNNH